MKPQFLDNRPRTNIFNQAGSALPVNVKASIAIDYFGEYEPVIIPLQATLPNGEIIDSDNRAIFMNSDGKYQQIGTVKGNYQLITPKQFCKVWDNNISLPVQAMGIAGNKGDTFYLASDLGQLNISGVPTQLYAMGVSPMNGLGSLSIRVTPVVMWCTNQLRASAARAVINIKISHRDAKLLSKTNTWLKHISKQIDIAKHNIELDFKAMLDTPIVSNDLINFCETIWQLPEKPNEALPLELLEKAQIKFENDTRNVNRLRDNFYNLFESDMTGIEYHSDNVFKMLNAASELEQYSRPIKERSTTQARANNVIFGKTANRMEDIYKVALQVAHSKKS